jgi:multiple sugar transport system permease protein
MSVIGTLFASSLVAYAFARLRFPGRDALFLVLLATMMVPGAVTMMPQFLIFRGLGWIDTLNPLWVPAFFGSAFNIFMLRQFFMSIPMELEDAAKIDGCGPFAVYSRIMLPLVKPALAAIAIMATLGAWNNFQGPLIYLSSPEKMPLAYALQLYQQQHSGEPGLLMAASTLVILPIILLFFFTQRYFIEGVSLTGLGGR